MELFWSALTLLWWSGKELLLTDRTMFCLALQSSARILPIPEETSRMALLHSSAVAVLPPKLNWLLGNCSVSMADWWSVVLCPCSTSVKSNYTSGLRSSTTWARHFWLSPLFKQSRFFTLSVSFPLFLPKYLIFLSFTVNFCEIWWERAAPLPF